MSIERIERADDPRVAAYRGVRDGELMRARGLFVAEGRHVVRRVVGDDRYRIESVLLNEAAAHDLAPAFAAREAVPRLVCADVVLADIAGYDVHRGCLALVSRPAATPLDRILAAANTLVV